MLKNILLALYILIATLLDFVTTLYFTTYTHISESNPFVKFLLGQSPLHFFSFKILALLVIFSVFYYHKEDTEEAFRLTAYCTGTIWMTAGLWNTYIFYF